MVEKVRKILFRKKYIILKFSITIILLIINIYFVTVCFYLIYINIFQIVKSGKYISNDK